MSEYFDKDYIGDSVYVQHDGYHIILTTENGRPGDPSNHIALEPSVLEALNRYVARIKDKYAQATLGDTRHPESTAVNHPP